MSAQWTRPTLSVTKPQRHFGGVYRTAEGERAGETIGGVPLQTASDAVVAAVQLGYKVADRQLTRGRRLARHLGGAARRAGIDSAAQPIDASERLMKRAMLATLEWFESAAGDPQSALRRIVRAEYQALGTAFGLAGEGAKVSRAERKMSADKMTAEAPPSPSSDADANPRPSAQAARIAVRHELDSARRWVRVRDAAWSQRLAEPAPLSFHHAGAPSSLPLGATLVLDAQGDELRVSTLAAHPSGVWVAAICDSNGLQLGHIEIEL
jgi:hypothetical protein